MSDDVRVEQGAKRIRVFLGGEVVADTVRPRLVWEKPYFPTYWLPAEDVTAGVLVPADGPDGSFDVKVGAKTAPGAARQEGDHVRLDWDAMDGWFEEDEEVIVHPRDPYHRVDIMATSRLVRIERAGVVLAESDHAHALFETGLPVRWYLPKVDVRMDLLEPTDSVTSCPYKGHARYWGARVDGRFVKDLAWSYSTPLPESQKIAGLVSFYNERLDVFVDGEHEVRPKTQWS